MRLPLFRVFKLGLFIANDVCRRGGCHLGGSHYPGEVERHDIHIQAQGVLCLASGQVAGKQGVILKKGHHASGGVFFCEVIGRHTPDEGERVEFCQQCRAEHAGGGLACLGAHDHVKVLHSGVQEGGKNLPHPGLTRQADGAGGRGGDAEREAEVALYPLYGVGTYRCHEAL